MHIYLPPTLKSCHLLTVITVHSLSVIYHANVSIKNTARNTYDIFLPCASVHCQTAPKDQCNYVKALYISIGAIFSQLPHFPTLADITSDRPFYHSKDHSHHYFTRRPLYFDIWREISVFLLAVLRKRLFGNRLPTLKKFYGAMFV